jgi:diguanylate cyclase (GGDEF)-like protein
MMLAAAPLYASVTLKVSANNPSLYSQREVPLRSFLPKGLRPDNVIDSGGLDIGYDVKRDQCYVYKDLVLEPKQTVAYNVEIDDIWLIDEETLGSFADKTKALVEKLKDTQYAEASLQVQKDIEWKITDIRAKQDGALVYKVGPTEHISVFEGNQETAALVENEIADLERFLLAVKENAPGGQSRFLRLSTKGWLVQTPEERKKILNVALNGDDSCLVENALEEEKSEIIFDSPQTVSFKVTVENPSAVETKAVPLKYFLAKEIKAKDIVDAGGLNVGFDFERGLYYVFNDEIALAPTEEKIFEVTLKNQWAIDKRTVYSSKIFIESMLRAARQVKGQDSVERLGQETLEQVYQLLERGDFTELTEDSVVAFRQDEKKLEGIARNEKKMEDLLTQAGVSPEEILLQQEAACKEAKELGFSKQELEKGLNTASLPETENLKVIAGTIFKGKSISSVSTWKIIGYIILFLGVISSVFYFVNIREQKSVMFDPLTGAFSRAYVLERFREELKIAKGGQKKCSLLVMDVDKFKRINDTHGHAAGDAILKEFVIALRKGVRATDLIGRFGGDEFMVILPTGEKKIARRIGEGIARIVEGSIIKVSPQLALNITTSIGVATYPDDSVTVEDLFDKADQALYKVKQRGGNGAEAFGGEAESPEPEGV